MYHVIKIKTDEETKQVLCQLLDSIGIVPPEFNENNMARLHIDDEAMYKYAKMAKMGAPLVKKGVRKNENILNLFGLEVKHK